jgi:hypothetical protein
MTTEWHSDATITSLTEANKKVQRMSAAGVGEDLGVWVALIADLVR